MNNFKQYFIDAGLINKKELIKDKVITKCFMPAHQEVNGTSLYINFESNRYRCFGKCCETGTIVDLLLKMGEQVDFNDIFSFEEFNQTPEPILLNDLTEIPMWKVDYRSKMNSPFDSYFIERGISPLFAELNKIHHSTEFKRIMIPIFCNGKCYGYTKRTTLNQDEILKAIQKYLIKKTNIEYPLMNILMMLDNRDDVTAQWNERYHKTRPDIKYINDKTLPKNQIVYEPLTNDWQDRKQCFLVEGSFDAIYANQLGLNAMAIIGGGITTQNLISTELSLVDYIIGKCQLYDNELILCFDNDQAGKKFTNQFRKLSKKIIKKIDYSILDKSVKDLQDINSNDLTYLLENTCF